MLWLQVGVERLLLLMFWIARILFILQGIAFGCATFAAFAAIGAESPAWLRGVILSGVASSGVFFAAGVVLIWARRWHAPAGGHLPAWPWRALLGLSLLALPIVAALGASSLPALWRRIVAQLTAIGAWDAATRSDPYGGIVLLPIMVALLVPLLLTAAAGYSIAVPLALVPLLATRSRLFPTLLAMGAICQVALVVTGWIAADAFSKLAAQALTSMTASGDAEVLRVADDLRWATGILTHTAMALMAPALATLAWLAVLRPSGWTATYFDRVAT